MKKVIVILVMLSIVVISCKKNSKSAEKKITSTTTKKEKMSFPKVIEIKGIAQNPEGIEFDKNDNTFLLSSLNAKPIIKVNLDGTFKPFTNGEKFPLSTAGIQIDSKRNRLLVAGFNGTELMDKNPNTKGTSFLRIYNLKTGKIEKDINLSSLAPDAKAYMANDVTYDNDGNIYVTDWYARVVYKVDTEGKPSIFWKNKTNINSGANGIDFNPDNYLLVSLVSVNEKGLYDNYGLVKIPLNDAKSAKVIHFENEGFRGFDGMVIKPNGNVIGVTNNGASPGGNTLIELTSKDNWNSAKVVHTKSIIPSTTVTITPNNKNYVIHQDFTNPLKKDWIIEQINF
jgi:sugar lactone lactonase YvrE